jgi:hypothetical protein
MNAIYENWTKEEFLTYLMLYAASIDGNFSEKKRKVICNKAGKDTYEKMYELFAEQNEYMRLQNILGYNAKTESSETEILQEMKNIFFLDNKLSGYEQHVLNLVQKLLKN